MRPFQVKPAYQVLRKKASDCIGEAALEPVRAELEAGRMPFDNRPVRMVVGGAPIE